MRRLIFVVGMHRSGTSAMTRALEMLGVNLGADFLELMPEVNRKGFWEDRALNAVNIRLLNALGVDWFSNRAPDISKLEESVAAELAAETRALLNQKIPAQGIFAFKDPRTAVLLPFWIKICASMAIEPAFLIALRHPRSVTDSIDKRNGFSPAKTYYLWLRHVVASLLDTAGYRRVVVEYDQFLDAPSLQLRRISSALRLDDTNHQGQADFVSRFLEKDLRHSRYTLEDLQADPCAPPIVTSVYQLLRDVANDKLDLDSQEVLSRLSMARQLLAETEAFLAYADDLEHWVAAAPANALDGSRQSALKAAYGRAPQSAAADCPATDESNAPHGWTQLIRARLARLLK